jgi:hypothetical protein
VTFGIELHEREGETVVELRSSNGAKPKPEEIP